MNRLMDEYANLMAYQPTIKETEAFSREIGTVDIVWLDKNNNVINQPLSPESSLGGMTAIKYDEEKEEWVEADTTNKDNNWYNYEAQSGNTETGGTSKWANARATSGEDEVNFVWIPRYAYKITYFDTEENKQAYRANNNSKTGIVGYSTIEGFIDVSTGKEMLLEGSEPINVTGTVQSTEYAEYIPHPAFEFDGAKAGIWVGKFESSGSTSAVKIVPNTSSLRSINVGDIFTACQGVKNTYNLTTSDSHLMKNTEWGAVSYLAESKYGRNGTEITINSNSSFITANGNMTTNKLQSTTGNEYGIYDMNGGVWEYVAGVYSLSNSYYDFSNLAPKYYNKYTTYNESKKIKGDGMYETSTTGSNSTSWYQDYSDFVSSSHPVFLRSGSYYNDSSAGAFSFGIDDGDAHYNRRFPCSVSPISDFVGHILIV